MSGTVNRVQTTIVPHPSRCALWAVGLVVATVFGLASTAPIAIAPGVVVTWVLVAACALLPWHLPIVGRIDLILLVPIALVRLDAAGAAVPIVAIAMALRGVLRSRAVGRRLTRQLGLSASIQATAAGCALAVHHALAELLPAVDSSMSTSMGAALVEALTFTGFVGGVRWFSTESKALESIRGSSMVRVAIRSALIGGVGSAAARLVVLGYAAEVGLGLVATVCVCRVREQMRMRRRTSVRIGAVRSTAHSWEALLVHSLNSGDPRREAARTRIEHCSVLLGARLGFVPLEQGQLATAARLHDLIERLGARQRSRSVRTSSGLRLPAAQPTSDQFSSVPDPGVAEILNHVDERWDGTGFPDRLAGDAIPPGARVLAVARAYVMNAPDGASPEAHVEAVAQISLEAGRAFCPRVVEQLTLLLSDSEGRLVRPSTDCRDLDAESGIDSGRLYRAREWLLALDSIEQARVTSSSRDDILILVAARLRKIVTHRCLVVYRLDDRDSLAACFAWGEAASRLRLVQLPVGERVSGRALLERRCVAGSRAGPRIVGDLEAWGEGELDTRLDATLAAPILSDSGGLGVLTLYDGPHREWSAEEREGLLAIAARIAPLMKGVEGADGSEWTDRLTGLPSAHFLRHAVTRRLLDEMEPLPPFGLLAFQIHGLEAALAVAGEEGERRVLVDLSRCMANHCQADETLVRYGRDVFVVLTHTATQEALVVRWSAFRDRVSLPFVLPCGSPAKIRLATAHAIYPDDANDLTGLLDTLDRRLTQASSHRRVVVPFRKPADHLAAS